MDRKTTHGLMITAIVAAIFIAAALTPAKTYTEKSETSESVNITNTDHESTVSGTGIRMISDKDVPLAATPVRAGVSSSLWLIVVAVSAVMTGIVIYEECKDGK